jgi:hypothetical protein
MHDTDENLTFEKLTSLCREVFADGHYESAYHLLVASEHYARDVENETSLSTLLAMAEEQLDWINTNAPHSIMSSTSAVKRHGVDFYGMLIRQINAHILIVRENIRRKHASRHGWHDESH